MSQIAKVVYMARPTPPAAAKMAPRESDYPKPIQEKLRVNWKRWGFERK